MPEPLNRTLLVVDSACVFSGLDYRDIYLEPVLAYKPLKPGFLKLTDMPTFFVWAYGSEWNSPSTCSKEGSDVEEPDGDGYQGRVKININLALTWFYYAVLKGSNLKDLWRRAQTLEDQTWATISISSQEKGHSKSLD